MLSPCNGSCVLDASGQCRVCRRTIQEIVRWATFTDDQRRQILERIESSRKQAAGGH
jgi:predicted Fe-S protein YdhL (DUF1289 family)